MLSGRGGSRLRAGGSVGRCRRRGIADRRRVWRWRRGVDGRVRRRRRRSRRSLSGRRRAFGGGRRLSGGRVRAVAGVDDWIVRVGRRRLLDRRDVVVALVCAAPGSPASARGVWEIRRLTAGIEVGAGGGVRRVALRDRRRSVLLLVRLGREGDGDGRGRRRGQHARGQQRLGAQRHQPARVEGAAQAGLAADRTGRVKRQPIVQLVVAEVCGERSHRCPPPFSSGGR